MSSKYPNSGALFINERRPHDRSPTMTGYVEITQDMMSELEQHMRDGSVRIRLAAWRKISSAGREFLSISISGGEPPSGQRGGGASPAASSAPRAAPVRPPTAGKASAEDDEIPF